MAEGLITRKGGGGGKLFVDGVQTKFKECNLNNTKLFKDYKSAPFTINTSICGKANCLEYLNSEFYTMGGYHPISSSYTHNNIYKFNGTSWTNISEIPWNFGYGFSLIIDNEIHIFGGYYNINPYTQYSFHYKWNGSSLINVSTLPVTIYNDGIGSQILLINNIINLFKEDVQYQYIDNSWMQISYTGPSKAKILRQYSKSKNILYAIGYNSGVGQSDSYYFYIYDYNTNTWIQKANSPIYVQNGKGTTLYNGDFIILGGYDNYSTRMYRWDFENNIWTYIGPQFSFQNGISYETSICDVNYENDEKVAVDGTHCYNATFSELYVKEIIK